jgi:Cu-Zn family superoxide dismutase
MPMSKFATVGFAMLLSAAWAVSMTLTPCGGHDQDSTKVGGGKVAVGVAPTKAICVMQSLSGSKVTGVVYFTQKGDMIEITGEIKGLSPGKHGFHVHEFGDMTDAKGLSTGGHFNPDNKMHGSPKAEDRHVGDLGNVTANKDGIAVLNFTDKMITLSGPHSIIGRGLIVHDKEDDEKTQPTGDAGGRVAGGVIGVMNAAPAKK